MNIAFTLCSNNYFAQALVLAKSFTENNSDFVFYVGLIDKKSVEIDYNQYNVKILPIDEIEPEIYSLAAKFDIIELNTAVKPHYFLHFFKTLKAEKVFYLDPDIFIYQSFKNLESQLDTYDILLTPHVLKPINYDGKKPFENDFLNYGLYNLGFIGIKKSMNSLYMLHWWKERTYNLGYNRLERGLFVDQLWINLVPIFFSDVYIIDHPGYNMGPWNLHERTLSKQDQTIIVNDKFKLYFYHFSNLQLEADSAKIHSVLNRFTLDNRVDLQDLYYNYVEQLKAHNFFELKRIPCHYVTWRKEVISNKEKEDYNKLSAKSKLLRKVKKGIPGSLKKLVLNAIKA